MCELCHDTKLTPFKRKDGAIVANTFLDCVCKLGEMKRYTPSGLGVIDFPVSWDWHRHYSVYYGKGDPGPNAALPFERGQQVSPPAGTNLTPIRTGLADLRNIVNQHIDVSKKKKEVGKFA